MTSNPTVLDSDFRYVDKNGNLMRTRTELSVAQMLDFLQIEYTYNYQIITEDKGKSPLKVDFKTEKGLIEVIDSEEDIKKYKKIKDSFPDKNIIAIGLPEFSSQVKELEEIVFYDKESTQTGSIFIDDPSFDFDYAHILPLVEKCSILHGHTSSVMVELVGQMKNNLLIDFGDAKKIIKDVLRAFDHKFFINRKYMKDENDNHYQISFEGPNGMFDLQVPKHTTYLLEGEATVENLSTEIIKLLAPRLPQNIEAVGVYIYEGFNKGSHIISRIAK